MNKRCRRNIFDAFKKRQRGLDKAMQYHDKYSTIQEAMDNMNKMVEKEKEQSQKETQSNLDHIPEGCVPIEVKNAMKDFQDIADKVIVKEEHLDNSISKFNSENLEYLTKLSLVCSLVTKF